MWVNTTISLMGCHPVVFFCFVSTLTYIYSENDLLVTGRCFPFSLYLALFHLFLFCVLSSWMSNKVILTSSADGGWNDLILTFSDTFCNHDSWLIRYRVLARNIFCIAGWQEFCTSCGYPRAHHGVGLNVQQFWIYDGFERLEMVSLDIYNTKNKWKYCFFSSSRYDIIIVWIKEKLSLANWEKVYRGVTKQANTLK